MNIGLSTNQKPKKCRPKILPILLVKSSWNGIFLGTSYYSSPVEFEQIV